MLNEQAAEARKAYRRKWAKENPEKVKAMQERYWSKKAAEQAAANAEQAQREQLTAPATA